MTTQLEKRQKSFLLAVEKRNRLRTAYQQAEQLFYDAQAGLLASKLQEGEPCPVCGSVHHPVLAQLPDKDFRKEELNFQKEELAEAEREMQVEAAAAKSLTQQIGQMEAEVWEEISNKGDEKYTASERNRLPVAEVLRGWCESLRERLEQAQRAAKQVQDGKQQEISLRQQLEEDSTQSSAFRQKLDALHGRREMLEQQMQAEFEAARKEAQEKSAAAEGIRAQSDAAVTAVAALLLEVNHALSENTARLMRKEELEQQILKQEREHTKNAEEVVQCDLLLARLAMEQEKRKEQQDNIVALLDGQSRDAIAGQVSGLREQKQQLEQSLEEAQKAEQDCQRQVTELEAAAAALQTQLEGSEELREEEVAAQKEQLTEQKGELTAQREILFAAHRKNQEIYDAVSGQQEKLAAVEQEYKWVKSLSDTANGTLSGKRKVELETYIQMAYFDRIIRRANLRLLTMSSGQYELKRREDGENKKEKAGLELSVIDHYNGTERSVKTLSGGESFQASLSLALGLSDEIQSTAGGIRLDTMFVDEGFGSLDEDSLNQAMRALEGLTEGSRMVGIISHVAELKERIERKIIVTKSRGAGGVGSNVKVEGIE